VDRDEVLRKLISIRHHCFLRVDEEGSFRMAFRTLNRLYVEMRDGVALNTPIARPERSRRGAARRPE
jgi:predicted acyl esterase